MTPGWSAHQEMPHQGSFVVRCHFSRCLRLAEDAGLQGPTSIGMPSPHCGVLIKAVDHFIRGANGVGEVLNFDRCRVVLCIIPHCLPATCSCGRAISFSKRSNPMMQGG